MNLDDPPKEKETVFLVFLKFPYEIGDFCRVFYTYEKAQKYCREMPIEVNSRNHLLRGGKYIIKEEKIE